MAQFGRGQVVEAFYDDGWYPGVVNRVNDDGTYVVHFNDGDQADDIRPDEIRLLKREKQTEPPVEDDDDDDIFGEELKLKKTQSGSASIPTQAAVETREKPPPQNLLNPEEVLQKVEAFLLPIPPRPKSEDTEENLLPTTRLHELLRELAIGEHVRMCQYLYRDSEDESQIAPEIRQLSQDGLVRITSKQLTDSLVEGRSRALALTRLCYGDNSLEYLRGIVDLASIYAMQGLWDQVSHHITIASHKLLSLTQSLSSSDVRSKSHDSALYLYTLFDSLRQHAMKNRGYVVGSFLKEAFSAIQAASQSSLASKTSQLKQEEYYKEICVDDDDFDDNEIPNEDNELGELNEDKSLIIVPGDKKDTNKMLPDSQSKTVAAAICQEIEHFLTQFLGPKHQWNETLSQFSPPSWGQMMSFLTEESKIVSKWKQSIERMIIPQNQAIFRLIFDLNSKSHLDLCHPVELAHNIPLIPLATKILSGAPIGANLLKLPAEISLLVDGQTGDVMTYMAPELRSLFSQKSSSISPSPPPQQVKYILPIHWIEFLARILFESNTEGGIDVMEYLHIQILNLMSLCHVYSNQLHLAEENMKNALNKIEVNGLEMESIAIDVYNGISQLMIVKHKQWHAEKKDRCLKLSQKWLETKDGKIVLLQEMKNIRNHYLEHKKIQLSSLSTEELATKMVLKIRCKYYSDAEVDPTTSSLEAASRYMIRTYEILEKLHGDHITVASACLAIASVQNILESFENSKEWLVRSIRIMEKLLPLPTRAIAFTQTQLSLILIKLKHPKSAEKVLSAAVDYYTNVAMKRLNRQSRFHSITSSSSPSLNIGLTGMNLGPQVLQDIETSLDLLKRLMILNGDNGAKWQAAEYAENMADLAEAAYGWDSQETAELRKQAAERQCRVRDWGRACGNFKKSLDAHHVLFGEKDKRSLAVQKQLQTSEKKRDAEMITSVADGNEEEGETASAQEEKE